MKERKVEVVLIIVVTLAIIAAFVLCCLIAGGDLKKEEKLTSEVKGAALLLAGETDDGAEIEFMNSAPIKGTYDTIKVYRLTSGDKTYIVTARVSEEKTILHLEVSGAYERPND